MANKARQISLNIRPLFAVFTVPQTYGNTHRESQLNMIKHTVDGTNPAPPKGWLKPSLLIMRYVYHRPQLVIWISLAHPHYFNHF